MQAGAGAAAGLEPREVVPAALPARIRAPRDATWVDRRLRAHDVAVADNRAVSAPPTEDRAPLIARWAFRAAVGFPGFFLLLGAVDGFGGEALVKAAVFSAVLSAATHGEDEFRRRRSARTRDAPLP